jgi:hypothetical protein
MISPERASIFASTESRMVVCSGGADDTRVGVASNQLSGAAAGSCITKRV